MVFLFSLPVQWNVHGVAGDETVILDVRWELHVQDEGWQNSKTE